MAQFTSHRGTAKFRATHDTDAVLRALASAIDQMRASGATEEKVAAWQAGFCEPLDGWSDAVDVQLVEQK
ncbi:MAG: hypothetical protein WA210_18175 [Burkholderiaceae bacterium]